MLKLVYKYFGQKIYLLTYLLSLTIMLFTLFTDLLKAK